MVRGDTESDDGSERREVRDAIERRDSVPAGGWADERAVSRWDVATPRREEADRGLADNNAEFGLFVDKRTVTPVAAHDQRGEVILGVGEGGVDVLKQLQWKVGGKAQ